MMKITYLRIYYNKYGELPLYKFDHIDQNILVTDIKLPKSNYLSTKLSWFLEKINIII